MSTSPKMDEKQLKFQRSLVNLVWFTRIMLIVITIFVIQFAYWALSTFQDVRYIIFEVVYIVANLALFFFVVPQVKLRKQWAVVTLMIFFLVTIFLFWGDFLLLISEIMMFCVYAFVFFRYRKRFR